MFRHTSSRFPGRRIGAGPRLCLAAPFLLALLLALPLPCLALKQATLILQWKPQAQFAGYYVALDKGFYRNHDVEMEILGGGPNDPPSLLLRTGRADFGTMFLSTAIRERAEGLPIVNLAQFVRRSSLLLVAKKAQGITTPTELNGRRVSLWGPEFRIQPEAFFQRHRLDVIPVPQGYTVNLFLRDGVGAVSAMWYNEYHTILNSGLDPDELTVFFMSDHGLNFPEDGLYTLGDLWEKDPELCRAVAQASIEGWRYAFAHPEEALDIVMAHVKTAHLPTNRTHQKWMLSRMQDIMYPPNAPNDTKEPGFLSLAEYRSVARALKKYGIISRIPPYEAFYVGEP